MMADIEKIRADKDMVRVGGESEPHLVVSAYGVELFDASGNDIASYGSKMRTGKSDGARTEIGDNGLDFFANSGANLLSVHNGSDTEMRYNVTDSCTHDFPNNGSVSTFEFSLSQTPASGSDITFNHIFTMGLQGINFSGGTLTFTAGAASHSTVQKTVSTQYVNSTTDVYEVAYDGAKTFAIIRKAPVALRMIAEITYTTSSTIPSAVYTLGTRSGDGGAFSVAAGLGMIAESHGQLACGTYNTDGYHLGGTPRITVGNGVAEDRRSNAFEVDSDGNIWCAGKLPIDRIYPVGSIYMSVNAADPGTLFGGTWERIEDRFLLAAGSAYGAGTAGGEAVHKLTADELPDHRHTFTTDSAGAHTHATGHKRSDAYGTGKADAMHFSGTFNVTSSSAGAHTHSGTTNGAGGSQAHNNMPPYLAVYMWERTA